MAGLAEAVTVHVGSGVAGACVAVEEDVRSFAGGARVGSERSTGVALNVAAQAVACTVHVVAVRADTSAVVETCQRPAGSALVRGSARARSA